MLAEPFYVSENTFSPVEKAKSSYDETLFFSGVRAFYIKNYQLAAAFFKEIVTKYPQSPFFISAYFLLGDCYKNMNNYDLAIKTYDEAIELAPKNAIVAETMFSIADIYEKKRMFMAARNIYSKVIKDYAGTKWAKEARFLLGASYYKENRCRSALEYFLSTRKSSEFYPLSMILAAECFFRAKDYAKAVLAYYYMSSKLNEIDPKKYFKELGDVGLALCKFEDYKEADRVFSYLESTHVDKIVGQSYIDRMRCDLKKGDFEDLRFRGEYILKNSKDVELKEQARKLMDEARLKRGEISEKTIDEIMAKYRNDPEIVSLALYVYAKKSFRENNCENTIKYLTKLKKMYPQSSYNAKANPMAARCLNEMIDDFYSSPSKEKIENIYRLAVLLKPKGVDLCRLSWGLIFSGDVGYVEKIMHNIKDDECKGAVTAKFFVEMGSNMHALDIVDKLAKVEPYTYYIDMILGDINYFNGDYKKAIDLYRNALKANVPLMVDYLNLRIAKSLMQLKKYNDALSVIKSVKASMFSSEAVYLQGMCYYKMGRFKQATVVFKNLVNNLNYRERVLFYLAMSYMKLNDKKSALEYYKQLKSFYPHSEYLRVLEALLL